MTVPEPVAGDMVRLRTSALGLRVERLLGRGGQGAVFEVRPEDGGPALALKWYRPETLSASHRNSIGLLVSLGRPSSAFLWPMETCSDDQGGFGYVMPLRPDRFVGMAALMRAAVRTGFAQICEAGVQLSDAFGSLHSHGMCYRDISFGNIFLDPGTGDVLIVDNDNVGIDGGGSPVLGTPYFVAPEVVRREATPSTATDRYSLAVLLFCMLVRHHPLLGAREDEYPCLDAVALDDLLGHRPLFIFDPTDDANRPSESEHRNALLFWPLLPGFVRNLFVQSFTRGLRDASAGRVTEGQWRRGLLALTDAIRHCPACGGDQFFDSAEPGPSRCAYTGCGVPLDPPPRLSFGASGGVILESGRRLLERHLDGLWAQSTAPVGEVVRHPVTGALGIRNDDRMAWTLVTPDGRRVRVSPGSAGALPRGALLEARSAVGRVL